MKLGVLHRTLNLNNLIQLLISNTSLVAHKHKFSLELFVV